MTSKTTEDYLKAIYMLQAEAGRAKTLALAGVLGITAGSVTEMLQRLARAAPPLIDYQSHRGATLTAEGRRAALDVIRRHRLLESFLHEVLGLTWAEVHEEADALEHHLSERLTNAIDRRLDFPQYDPHGEPIPGPDGRLPADSTLALSAAEPEARLRIVRISPRQPELLAYLDQLGIGIHTIVVMEDKAPLEGPIRIRVERSTGTTVYNIGQSVGDQIFVEIL